MGYAFLSYSSKNKTSADALRELFNKNNIDTWMAPYSIPIGSDYPSEITKAIRDCSCFVLLLSKHSQESEGVNSEVQLAKMRFKKKMIFIEIEKLTLNDSFEFYISNTHYTAIHKFDEKSQELKTVLQTVRTYTGANVNAGVSKKMDQGTVKPPEDSVIITKRENGIKPKCSSFEDWEKYHEKYYHEIKDVPVPYVNNANSITDILDELSKHKGATRIKTGVIPYRLSGEVDSITIPNGICVIESSAFSNIKVKRKVVIPSSVTKIGSSAFNLMPSAYVECDRDSYAYFYCLKYDIVTSVEIIEAKRKKTEEYKANGVCSNCGGSFSGLFKKRCSHCGKIKDY